jgi:hypothetical protein
MSLVMPAYSIAMRSLGKRGLSDWFSGTLSTMGEVCRALLDETVRNTMTWMIDQIGIDCGKS